ncbi:Thermoresistant gluconokinase [Vibrio ruber DSM 16370]|uniref:Gluconokinase n=1 Tax=Vibrio ruber (strain DSM 16370 / JCM 11486 / BCRC 17186 / CECT 7878 / LMG 23124 / VR1) TaxID=1123498 RepID=A0A1R4LF71_VIBR1|nr:gluconokinase [Vibrio ruber]SJN55190.1 Thermoresistant gluconokinase [Vibrio ruber DSM 16370]
MSGSSIVVMGVCGCGKSTIGARLADRLGRQFIDGDDLHPSANIQKMAAGQPLDDADRQPWLARIREAAQRFESQDEHGVLVCSALKKDYRDQIRMGNNHVTFVFLDGDMALILERMQMRQGHFMKDNMVKSQFDTLERPDQEPRTIVVNIEGSIEQVVERIITELKKAQVPAVM